MTSRKEFLNSIHYISAEDVKDTWIHQLLGYQQP
ncbi:hypothetical protein E2C01_090982 [Portunus trituberculatus]|uniref:Uncharacterized protein n=1 Tax=Portunus trituberculatus TaxID=210409 RepID=A0A5B7JN71_PORTR|nr:hypothetical protein [Portunus trituberculatus]